MPSILGYLLLSSADYSWLGYRNVVGTQAPVAPDAVSFTQTIAYNTPTWTNISFTGGTPTSVAVITDASHGTTVASGTGIQYTPDSGYTGADFFTYQGTNDVGTGTTGTASLSIASLAPVGPSFINRLFPNPLSGRIFPLPTSRKFPVP